MDFDGDGITLEKIRGMDLAAYLEELGIPVSARRKNDTDYWYLSPFSNERTASFHINRVTNKWYDFSNGFGGSPVDFCLRFYNCTIPELTEKFNGGVSPQRLLRFYPSLHEGRLEDGSKLVVLADRPLYQYALKDYLHSRSIPVAVAERFCREVDYQLSGSRYFGIGFKNDAGGWEIRNKNYKQSSAPKEITCLGSGASTVHVFEGFMDFLSWQCLHPYTDPASMDFVVLNGAGMMERALPFLEQHLHKHLWLDRDVTGKAYTQYAMSKGNGYFDESPLYEHFKDLNEWLKAKGVVQKRDLHQKSGLRQTTRF